jgi:hypothetical protein
MRTGDTILGLVVLALVAGGVYWVRWRPQAAGTLPTAAAGQAQPVSAPHDAPPTLDAAIPDVTVDDGAVFDGDLRVTLSVSPRPPVAFTKKRFRVRVESGGVPRVFEGGRISFEMVMPMGDHRYTLGPGEDGWQEAEVVLPFCKSGNPRWYAIVEGTVDGRPFSARFRLDLAQRPSR